MLPLWVGAQETASPTQTATETLTTTVVLTATATQVGHGPEDHFLLGPLVKRDFEFETGNDNFFHGLYRLFSKKIILKDGDDVGRTFSLGGHYNLWGEKAGFRLEANSTGWGRPIKHPDYDDVYLLDDQGRFYQQFLERDMLTASLRLKTSIPWFYWIAGGEFEYDTDNGPIVQKIQNRWHQATKGYKVIQYHNVHWQKNQKIYRILTGSGLTFHHDVPGLGSDYTVEGILKNDLGYARNSEFHIRTDVFFDSADLNNRPKERPILLCHLWATGGRSFANYYEYQYGIDWRTTFQSENWYWRPFWGINVNFQKEDQDFKVVQKDLIYYTLGVEWIAKNP